MVPGFPGTRRAREQCPPARPKRGSVVRPRRDSKNLSAYPMGTEDGLLAAGAQRFGSRPCSLDHYRQNLLFDGME